MQKIVIKGRSACKGFAAAEAVVCPESILGMVGLDVNTGIIVEKGHSQKGQCITGKVLVLPCSKGSCGWSCHFHSAKVKGNSPAAWLFSRMDSKTGVVSVICDVPVVADFSSDIDLFSLIETGDFVEVNGDTVEVTITKK
jgi:predicted aconitase with swiveling domain